MHYIWILTDSTKSIHISPGTCFYFLCFICHRLKYYKSMFFSVTAQIHIHQLVILMHPDLEWFQCHVTCMTEEQRHIHLPVTICTPEGLQLWILAGKY